MTQTKIRAVATHRPVTPIQARSLVDLALGVEAKEIVARDMIALRTAQARLTRAVGIARSRGQGLTDAEKAQSLITGLSFCTEEGERAFENQICGKCIPADVGPLGCRVYLRAMAGDWGRWRRVGGCAYCLEQRIVSPPPAR